MLERTRPPFRADHVGSLLRPQALLLARSECKKNQLSREALHEIEDSAVRAVVKRQEETGLRAATDGEFRRASWHMDFYTQIKGVGKSGESADVPFQTEQGPLVYPVEGLRVTSSLTLDHPIFADDFDFLKSITNVTPKLTIPSPSVMHRRGGNAVINPRVYPDIDKFWSDLAAVYQNEINALGALGCTYLQLDDTSFAALCDEKYRLSINNLGVKDQPLHEAYISLFNEAIKTKPDEMTVCVHTCRGNHHSAWINSGSYDFIAEALFTSLNVDAYFLEYDDARSGGFEPLRFMPKGKKVVLGLITTKKGALEKKDDLKRRIDEAAKFVSIEQLCISPQCGFASTLEGNRLTEDEQFAKLRLAVDVAREVWGEV